MTNLVDRILYFILLQIVTISFILVPLTNDARIYLGIARLQDMSGIPFPQNIDAVWEIKPVANRGLNYLLYKIVTPLTGFATPLFPVVMKSIVAAIILLVCYYFAKKVDRDFTRVFIISALSFLTISNFFIMQAEMWSVLFALLCVALLLSKSAYAHYTAGLVFLFVFLFKGITGILLIPILCAFWLLNNEPLGAFKRFVISTICSFIGYGILCLTIFPNSIPDMILSSYLSRAAQVTFHDRILTMLFNFLTLHYYLPVILIGWVIGAYLAFYYCNHWHDKRLFVLVIMWLSTLSIVYIQGEFFIYHYIVLILPVIVSWILLDDIQLIKGKFEFFEILLISMVVLWAMFNVCGIGYQMNIEKDFWAGIDARGAEINSLYPLQQEQSVLFLDPGNAPYYFGVNSSCRYVSPLPVERSQPTYDNKSYWNLTALPAYREEYNCIMQYNGTYIIANTAWFRFDIPERYPIRDKINAEYTLIYNKSWDIYQRKPS